MVSRASRRSGRVGGRGARTVLHAAAVGTWHVSTWVGVFLDASEDTPVVDWESIAEIVEDAFRLMATASDFAELDRR